MTFRVLEKLIVGQLDKKEPSWNISYIVCVFIRLNIKCFKSIMATKWKKQSEIGEANRIYVEEETGVKFKAVGRYETSFMNKIE